MMKVQSVLCAVFAAFALIEVTLAQQVSTFPNLYLQLVDRTNSTKYTQYTINDAAKILKNPTYKSWLPTIVYSHGYSENVNVWTVQAITAAVVANGGYNLILVDYGAYSVNYVTGPSVEDYLNVINSINAIGPIVGNTLWDVFGDNIRRFQLFGHSLGGHLSAYINRAIASSPGNCDNYKAKKIVALDPAGPFFFSPTGETAFAPLNNTDAQVVYVIHTDTVAAGAPVSIGTADFYPNNGFQPGCPPLDFENLLTNINNFCSHQKSISYFAEAFATKTPVFNAVKCDSWTSFSSGLCRRNQVTFMGQVIDDSVEGNFYLQTNAASPYSRGKNGLIVNNFPNLNFVLIDLFNSSNSQNFTFDEFSTIPDADAFSSHRDTAIYTYGYIETMQSTTIQQITAAFRVKKDTNLIIVDWAPYNTGSYFGTINNAAAIGNIIGAKLWATFGFGVNSIELIGHSLGAHLSANINRGLAASNNYGQRVPLIYGLDPAGPGFFNASNNNSAINNGLNASDANVVYVIHTDTLHYGAPVKIGTVDFWPNGGFNQTSCPPFNSSASLSVANLCSHQRSVTYFSEAVASSQPVFHSSKCSSWSAFKNGTCQPFYVRFMGQDGNKKFNGDFYLQTNGASPYSRNQAGLTYNPNL